MASGSPLEPEVCTTTRVASRCRGARGDGWVTSIAIGRTAGIRLAAKDYFGKFDFKDATGFDGIAGTSSKTAHNLAFTAGLRLDF